MEKNFRNINILLKVDKQFIPKAEYVFRTFCRIAGLKPRFFYQHPLEEVHVYFGVTGELQYPIHIFHDPEADTYFQDATSKEQPILTKHLFNNEYIPFIFSKPGEIFSIGRNHITIRKDIISSAFYFLSCWQENNHEKLDNAEDQRFSFNNSIQALHHIQEQPVVDRYYEIFIRTLNMSLPEYITTDVWPQKRKGALSLSHDIDYWEFWDKNHLSNILQYNKNRMKANFFKASYKYFCHFADKKIFKQNSVKRNKSLYKKEVQKKYQATYFLLTGNELTDNRQNYFSDTYQREQILKTYDKSNLGIHGSPSSAYNKEVLEKEIDVFVNNHIPVRGIRFHYLNFEYQKTFEILEKTGISYDSTLGYWEKIGYRAGISYPFYPFNIKENRPFHVLEIPLSIMDTTLLSPNAMNFTPNKAYNQIKKMIDSSVIHESHLSVLWHNTTFDFIDFPGWGKLYWDIIKYAEKKNMWICSLDQIFDYWIKR